MNQSELEIRYRSKVRFWYRKFEALSDITDRLQAELERQRKIVEKVVSENTQLIIEFKALQQEQKMSFENIVLEKQ